MMKQKTFFIFILLASFNSFAESESEDPDNWFRNSYAPLWGEDIKHNVEAIIKSYDKTFIYHPDEGETTIEESGPSLKESIDGWLAEEWISSEITGYDYDLLNPVTASYKVKWQDFYLDGSTDFSCSWYFAKLKEKEWLITQLADISCEEHGL